MNIEFVIRRLTLVKAAVSILFGFFQAPLFALQNSSTKITFNTYRIFYKSFNWNFIKSRDFLEYSSRSYIDPPRHLIFYILKNLLLVRGLVHTYYGTGAFKGRENMARNALRASVSAVLDVLTINFLSKMASGFTSGSRRSCTGFLNWFVK